MKRFRFKSLRQHRTLCRSRVHVRTAKVYNSIIVLRTLKLFVRRAELNPTTENNSRAGTQEIYKMATDYRPFEIKVPVSFEMSVNILSLSRRHESIFFTNNPTALLYIN
jgi:hypothetical protein